MLVARHVLRSFSLCIAFATVLAVGEARAEGCVTIGGSIFCGTTGAHNGVGRQVIFNQGPRGRLTGSILTRERYRGLYGTQVLPRERAAAPGPGTPKPGSFIDFSRGRDFGAFEFPFVNKRGGSLAGARAGRLGPRLPAFGR